MFNGADVSQWQGPINFFLLKKQIEFIFVKCTRGINFKDPNFGVNAHGARNQKILTGAYHFADPKNDGAAEANFFLNSIRPILPDLGDLIPVLDIETEGFTTEQIHNYISRFCETLEPHLFGRKVIIYTYTAFYLEHELHVFSDHLFWIADYSAECGIPGWSIWQHSETGRLNGVQGNIDLDVAPTLEHLMLHAKPTILLPNPTLKIGDQGESVKSLQLALDKLNHPVVADGSFGVNTQTAVEAIQKQLGIVPDGIYGEMTHTAILKFIGGN